VTRETSCSGMRRLRRNVKLGPRRLVIGNDVRFGVPVEILDCGHVVEAKPINGRHRLILRRCADCGVMLSKQFDAQVLAAERKRASK
jgi:hypothetical protein